MLPADLEVLDLLVRRVADELVQRGVIQLNARPFSQREGERPAGCGKPTYLKVWARAVAGGDTEAWAEGRARLMSAGCWGRWAQLARTKPKKEATPSAPEVTGEEALLAKMGARRAS